MGIGLNSSDKTEKIWVVLMKLGAFTGCHQLNDRSLSIAGYQLPLCARCTGILAGQLLALISYPFYRDFNFKALFVCAAVSVCALGVDGVSQLKGLWVSNNARRLFTGLSCGFFTFAAFFRGFAFVLNKLFYLIP